MAMIASENARGISWNEIGRPLYVTKHWLKITDEDVSAAIGEFTCGQFRCNTSASSR